MTPRLIQSFKQLTLVHLAITALGTLGFMVGAGVNSAASFACGSGLLLVNVLALAWAWWRVITQKTIAWTVLIIVIKYAVLLSLITYLSRVTWFVSVAAGFGIASFLISALAWAVVSREKEKA